MCLSWTSADQAEALPSFQSEHVAYGGGCRKAHLPKCCHSNRKTGGFHCHKCFDGGLIFSIRQTLIATMPTGAGMKHLPQFAVVILSFALAGCPSTATKSDHCLGKDGRIDTGSASVPIEQFASTGIRHHSNRQNGNVFPITVHKSGALLVKWVSPGVASAAACNAIIEACSKTRNWDQLAEPIRAFCAGNNDLTPVF